jgi:hypothetical protein
LRRTLRYRDDWRGQRFSANTDADSNGNADTDSNADGNSDTDSNSFGNAVGYTVGDALSYADPVTNSQWEAQTHATTPPGTARSSNAAVTDSQ